MMRKEVINEELNINNVSKYFKIGNEIIDVLSDIKINVKDGEFLSIVGSSGCGKSTLLKMIVGLEETEVGEIKLGEKIVTKPTVECGMVFQEPRLFPWLTVEKNIGFGISRKINEKKKIIEEHIELVGLNGFEKALPRQLSGGMQQRVSIARALVNRPKLLLLDEPFGALDALTRINMQNEILRIWRAESNTMILVTHDIDEAIYLGDRVIIMSERPGTIKKILNVDIPRPRDRTSLEFVRVRKIIYDEFFKGVEIPIEYNI